MQFYPPHLHLALPSGRGVIPLDSFNVWSLFNILSVVIHLLQAFSSVIYLYSCVAIDKILTDIVHFLVPLQ